MVLATWLLNIFFTFRQCNTLCVQLTTYWLLSIVIILHIINSAYIGDENHVYHQFSD